MDTWKRHKKLKQKKETSQKTCSCACMKRNKDDMHSRKKQKNRWRRWPDVYFMCIDNSNLTGLDSVARCNDSAVAISDKLGMTEALKSADSPHFEDGAHLFWGLTRVWTVSQPSDCYRGVHSLSWTPVTKPSLRVVGSHLLLPVFNKFVDASAAACRRKATGQIALIVFRREVPPKGLGQCLERGIL